MAVEKQPVEAVVTPPQEGTEVDTQTKFIPISRIRDHVKSEGFRFSPEALGNLDTLVEQTLKKAMERAKENGRATIKACDI